MGDTRKITIQRASAIARKWGHSVKGAENGTELFLEEGTLLKEAGDWYYTPKTFEMETGPAAENTPTVTRAAFTPKTGSLTVAFKGGNPRRLTRTLKRARSKVRRGNYLLSESEKVALAQYSEHVRRATA